MTTYDIIVVGAGAAGAPLAARLSEHPERSVLLLEAGPIPELVEEFPEELLNPGTLQGAFPGHPNNWSFLGNLTSNRQHRTSRGKILGGSTTINGAYFIRARREDFERWSTGGNDEWTYDKALPFYRKLEFDHDFGQTDCHGGYGPMQVARPSQSHAVTLAFKAAAQELGFREELDKNAQEPPGYGPLPLTVANSIRWNAGIAFLLPILGRSNLTVKGMTFVRKVVFAGSRAIGVEVDCDGGTQIIRARTIILSAGAIKTPHLLLLSGVGPRDDLSRHGIDVVFDSPGVGANFTDHPNVALHWESRCNIVDYSSSQCLADVLNFSAAGSDLEGDLEVLPVLKPEEYLLTGSSKAHSADLANFYGTRRTSIRSLGRVWLDRLFRRPSRQKRLFLLVALQLESSRGQISLESSDPHVPPRIDYNYLSTPDDMRRMREGIRTAASLLTAQAFAHLFERFPDLDDTTLQNDVLLDQWLLSHLGTASHLCGSAKFGNDSDPMAVVDQYGRVRGVTGLRIADTSILPTAPSRGPAATAMLIGEMIADFVIRESHEESASVDES